MVKTPMGETRQERRERRRSKEKARIPQHGASLRRVYKNAVAKRAEPQRPTTRQTD